ncbi:hypothetical protein SCUCBS95973_000515 [Sporothrix curviconia]|uniref:Zn(2)-C6 fungal-type domain-containing protein n=1 Tax=Sporothrix curviconia TaxID=1260050 RepID=A0ABP0AQV4_9PEZI
MSEISSDWLLYTGCEPKKNRAKLVCIFCHSKKIKCDLQPRIDRGRTKCSKCDASGRECRPRTSKRIKRPLPSSIVSASNSKYNSNSNSNSNTGKASSSSTASSAAAAPASQRSGASSPASSPDAASHNATVAFVHPGAVSSPTAPTVATVATSIEMDVRMPTSNSAASASGRRTERHSFSQRSAPQQQHLASSGLAPLPPLPAPPQHHHHLSHASASMHAAALHNSAAAVMGLAPGAGPQTTASPTEGAGRSHAGDVDTGFLQLYGPENEYDAERQEIEAQLGAKSNLSDPRQQELLQSFAETYFEYCYPWCPVLERNTLADNLQRSPLLANALATAASHVQPPLVPHEGPGTYYKQASSLFYHDEEPDILTQIKAVSLFYWWAPRPPSTVHRHSSWWWTSVVIRHAQQMNFHREPRVDHPLRHRLDLSARRRIWWTAFARERLTALCQSKPCIIDPEDCSISEPTLADFPPEPALQKKGEIFIYWVKLCAIIGKVAKVLMRPPRDCVTAGVYAAGGHATHSTDPMHLRRELADWVQSLPAHLQLPIQSARTQAFDRDVHQLHLPYLTTIIILNMKRSSHALPEALPPAILAASCIARILRDILARGNVRYLMAITCWYSGMAFAALLQAAQIPELAVEANEALDVLAQTASQLQTMWASANIIRQGFDRLRSSVAVNGGTAGSSASASTAQTQPTTILRYRDVQLPVVIDAGGAGGGIPVGGVAGGTGINRPGDFPPTATTPGAAPGIGDTQDLDFDWVDLFPFVTPATNKIAEVLLNGKGHGPATRLPSPEDLLFQDAIFSNYQDIVEPFHDIFMSELIRQSWTETTIG